VFIAYRTDKELGRWLELTDTIDHGVGLTIKARLGDYVSAGDPLVVLHYNDLVFLRLRARRNWSNVETSLKKRKNLIPAWESVVKGYLAHEAELQQGLAELRQQYQSGLDDTEEITAYLAQEQQLLDQLRVRVEAYPELKAQQIISETMDAIARLETEIALLRQGYNNAVTQYNTRIDTFPDLLLARPFGFEPITRWAV
jgi:LemA protein